MIFIQSRSCPAGILARTRNANSAANRAAKAGWDVAPSFAIGGEDDVEVQSIVLRLYRDGVRMTARWTGPVGQESLNFEGAWRLEAGVRPMTWTEFSWAIDGEGEKPLTEAGRRALEQDQEELLSAMALVGSTLDARPITVIPQGTKANWCSGTVMREGGGLPAMKLKCINPAAPGDNLCGGPCRSSVEG